MLCRNPFVRDPSGKVFKAALMSGNLDLAVNGIPFPCGQCLPCRINKRRLWTHRLLLEQYSHAESVFITLTYSEENLPHGGTLCKSDLQKFFKRLRKNTGRKLRYYAVGEYGSKTHRPHYHAIVYGLGLDSADSVGKAWPYGLVHVGECNQHSVQYVAGYVTKKFVKKGDDIQKEFATMSRKPGLGFDTLVKLVPILQNPKYKHLFQGDKTIPDGLRHGNKFLPFDRFSKDKLSYILEYDADATGYILEMCRKYYSIPNRDTYAPLVETLLEESKQRNVQIERRFKIFNRRETI